MSELTEVQREFLKIAESFMHEKEYHFPEHFHKIKELYELAAIHKMTAAVYEQICQEEVLRKEEYCEIVGAFKNRTIHDVVHQSQREAEFLKIYKKLSEKGINPLVVKGAICRKLYAKPDYRVSGDEDLMIEKEEFALCDQILLAEGMQREQVDFANLPYEIPYIHPQTGVYMELHFKLFPEEMGAYGHLNQEFAKAFETSIWERVQDMEVRTLEPTLHMFYLICHSFKHFLHGGFGIRQVCDMVKMMEYYRGHIEWQNINERLKMLRMDVFWYGLVEIGRRYLGFVPENSAYPREMLEQSVDCQHLLLDLLDSGVYGDSTIERKHSSNITLAAAESGKKDMLASMKATLFPKMDYMKKNYEWLERFPFLLPVAWGMRVWNYLVGSSTGTKRENGESTGMEIGRNRVDLLREYHIID